MKKLLLISHNDIICSLYKTNLKVYVNCELDVSKGYQEALDKLEKGESYDLILCESSHGEHAAGALIYQYLVENDVKSELILLGRNEDVPEDVDAIGDVTNIPDLIKMIAKKVNITAKDMIALDVPDMFPLSIRLFYSLKISPCNVYCKTEDNYQLIFSKDGPVWPEIKKYLDQGVGELYVHAMDRLKLVNESTSVLLKIVKNKRDGASADEKIDVTEQGFEAVAQAFFGGDEFNEELLQLSNECMSMMQDVVKEIPDLKNLIILLAKNKSSFLFSHSVIATFVAEHIVTEISWGSDAHREKLKFVFFFHDIFLAPIYAKYPDLTYEDSLVLDKRLSEEEKEQVLSHAKDAAEALSRYPKIPMGADTIIRQHHGTTNGLGFAIQYKDDISPLSKVMIISEAFTESILRALKEEGVKLDKKKAIEDLKLRFRKHTYIKIIETLENIPV